MPRRARAPCRRSRSRPCAAGRSAGARGWRRERVAGGRKRRGGAAPSARRPGQGERTRERRTGRSRTIGRSAGKADHLSLCKQSCYASSVLTVCRSSGRMTQALWSRRSCSTRRTSRSRSSTGRRRSRSGARGRSRSSLCTTAKSGRSRSASSCRRSSACCATSRSSAASTTCRSRARTSTRATTTRASTAARCSRRAELTFDHVVPVAQGGRKDWENIVTCCVTCNRRKGGRTPAEAGMHLIRVPRRPEQGAGHPDHGRPQERAGQLARLLLLEHRARRDAEPSRRPRPAVLRSRCVRRHSP